MRYPGDKARRDDLSRAAAGSGLREKGNVNGSMALADNRALPLGSRPSAVTQFENGGAEGESQGGERRGAVVEADLGPEEIIYLQQFREVRSILKFNFAGSGEKVWKTHKPKYAKPGKQQMGTVPHQSAGKKYSKQKQTLDKNKTVIEYAGPLKLKGAQDAGQNSTEKNLADAKMEFDKFMSTYVEAWLKTGQSLTSMPRAQIYIKGFSRGAATASVFANWIKSSTLKGAVDVNLVLIDPVHGSGKVGKGLMPGEQDVSGVYDEGTKGATGTTYLLPITSGHEKMGSAFTPQRLKGYQRLIIGYGEGIKHSFGLGESEKSTLKYKGKPVKGMHLSTLPTGLFVVNAANMNIIPVQSMKLWNDKFRDEILGKANKKEGRDKIIENALKQFF